MALLGPQGFREVGELIIQLSNYSSKKLSEIDGVRTSFNSNFFKRISKSKIIRFILSSILKSALLDTLWLIGIYYKIHIYIDIPQNYYICNNPDPSNLQDF